MPHVSIDFFKSENVQSHKKAYQKGATFSVVDDNYEAPVYVMELLCILKSEAVPSEGTNKTFNGKEFIPSYLAGFKEGVRYFSENHAISIDTFYNNNEKYIKDLHICYFHNDPITNNGRGWNRWQNSYPVTIQHSLIKKYGFYAGIITELEQLKLKFPAAFKDFRYRCEFEQQIRLETMFAESKPGYKLFLELLKELDFTDGNGNVKANVKANEILGMAVALKESHHAFLKETFTDNDLMEKIQNFLHNPFTPDIKRRGKGYDLKTKEAKDFINRFMKARAK